jgi:hypothetical protein
LKRCDANEKARKSEKSNRNKLEIFTKRSDRSASRRPVRLFLGAFSDAFDSLALASDFSLLFFPDISFISLTKFGI